MWISFKTALAGLAALLAVVLCMPTAVFGGDWEAMQGTWFWRSTLGRLTEPKWSG